MDEKVTGPMTVFDRAVGLYTSPPVQRTVQGLMALIGRERRFARRYLARPGIKALQIGAGGNRRSGWLHTNWFPIRPWGRQSLFLDATRPFPFPDRSFDYIFSEHMIEHVPFAGGKAMLAECFRILRPGGKIRLSTPDLRAVVRLLGDDLNPLEREFIAWGGENYLEEEEPRTAVALVNAMMNRWGHQFIYDEITLEAAMASAGFQSIARVRVGASGDPQLDGLDHAARMPAGVLDLVSMVMEARKPDA